MNPDLTARPDESENAMSEWTIWVCPDCRNQARAADSGVVYCHNCADSRPVKVDVVPKASVVAGPTCTAASSRCPGVAPSTTVDCRPYEPCPVHG